MKQKGHSVGWHTVKMLDRKIKTQRAVIISLTLLYVATVVLMFTGGR